MGAFLGVPSVLRRYSGKYSGLQKLSEFFSTVTEVENAWDQDACLKVKVSHEEITRKIQTELKKKLPDFYVLSTGCTACEVCACPAEPCRHPEQRLASMESHGIAILQLVSEMGLNYRFGNDSVVYFSMILF